MKNWIEPRAVYRAFHYVACVGEGGGCQNHGPFLGPLANLRCPQW